MKVFPVDLTWGTILLGSRKLSVECTATSAYEQLQVCPPAWGNRWIETGSTHLLTKILI